MDALAIEKWLEKKTGKEFYTPGLKRVSSALDKLNLKPNSKIITIGGTNGKGSVTRLLSSTLSQKYTVASFTSPHLNKITERFSYNNELISECDLEKSLLSIDKYDFELTYYELLFVAFLYVMKDKWPEFILLEVGLGGRLDATNALDSDLAVVTSISRDHQEYLGARYNQILFEKLAIARKQLITGFDLDYLKLLTVQYCRVRGIKYTNVTSSKSFKEVNELLVKEVLSKLGLNIGVFTNKINRELSLPNKEIVFYGSHNPDAARKLVQFLKQEHYNKDTISYDLLVLSFSHRSMKDLQSMLKTYKLLSPAIAKKMIVTSFSHPKAEAQDVLIEVCKLNGIEFVKDIKKEVINANTIICSGSNYFFRSFLYSTRSLRI